MFRGGCVQNVYVNLILNRMKIVKSFLVLYITIMTKMTKTNQKFSTKLKRKALDDPCQKLCKILHRESTKKT